MWIPEDFIVQITQSAPRTMHCWIAHSFSENTFYLTLVYGDNDEMERKRLWKMLVSLEIGIQASWLIMGDFNHLLHLDDRIGGLSITQQDIQEFW